MVRPAALARETPRASSGPLDSCTASRRPARSAAARPARHTAQWEGDKECPVRATWAGQQEGRSHRRICLWAALQGLSRLDRVGGHTSWGLQPLGKGFHQSPGVVGIPRASPACGRLGADRVDREGCRAFGSSGNFSPAASVLPPGPAATGTRRARPREATDEGKG